MRLLDFLDALLIYMSVIVICLFCTPFFIIIYFLPRSKRFKSKIFHWASHLFFKAIIYVCRIKVVYKGFGAHHKKPVIYIANHQSSLDIPLIGSAIEQFPLIWLARSELEESFLLKIVLRCCAVVTQVGNAKNSALSLRKLFVLLKDSSVCPAIFPEGSRYDDGLVHEFFNGFAFLARETQRSVVPILIENACTVYPRGVFFVNRKPVIFITQGPEFFIGSDETIDAFSMRVKAWFLEKNGMPY